MHVEYDILTRVQFHHRYFSSQKLECLTVCPNNRTETILRNTGLVFKPFQDGFVLLYETLHNGQPRGKKELLDVPVTLRFSLGLTDTHFFNYTDGGMENLSESVYYFHNVNAQFTGSVSTGKLHQEEFVSGADVSSLGQLGENLMTKPFALMDLELSENLQETYTLTFREKQTYWRYVLVSDHLKNLVYPAIIGEQGVFQGPDKIRLPDKREVLSFVSSSPISLRQATLSPLKLVENYENESSVYKVVKRSLPVPDISSISTLGGKEKENTKTSYSEIFIY